MMHSNPHLRPQWLGAPTALAVLTTGALLLASCGDDDVTDAIDTGATDESTTTTTTTTTMATTAAEDRDAGSAVSDADDLLGTWESPTARELTYIDDGTSIVSEGGEVLNEGTWTATSTTIELVPGSGALACPEPATYEWKIEDDTLTFTAVSDPCPGRLEGLDGVSRTRAETTFSPDSQDQAVESGSVPQGVSDVSAGDTIEIPNLGGLRFVMQKDRSIYLAPGFVNIGGLPTGIDLVSVIETLGGEPLDSVDAVASLIDEASLTIEEADSTTIAGHDARVLDFTAERVGEPRPDDAVFRFERGGIGGWGPIGEGRVWLLDTPRGILLFSAGVLEPGAADLSGVIAEAEGIFATLEFVEVTS